jgi:hypothetical protein
MGVAQLGMVATLPHQSGLFLSFQASY